MKKLPIPILKFRESFCKKYHIECQSTTDGSMLVRFFEYDSQIALDDAVMDRRNCKKNTL